MNQEKIDPRVFDLYDDYTHDRISRRQFLSRSAAITVGGVSALAMAQALLPRYAEAQTVSFTDQRIRALYTDYPSPGQFRQRGSRWQLVLVRARYGRTRRSAVSGRRGTSLSPKGGWRERRPARRTWERPFPAPDTSVLVIHAREPHALITRLRPQPLHRGCRAPRRR